MNRIAVSSVVGGLLGGRNCNRYISTAVAVRPLDGAEFLNRRNGDVLGGFYWRRMMSTVPQSAETASLGEKEQKESQSSVSDDAKKGSDSVVVSNYWGIQRPKITREDGSEWPWNCFMVRSTSQNYIYIFLKFEILFLYLN